MSSPMIRDRESLLAWMEQGKIPKFLFFWGHNARAGEVGKQCLSQWWPAQFEIDGVSYPTAEHFMMAEKARLFGDDEARSRILKASKNTGEKILVEASPVDRVWGIGLAADDPRAGRPAEWQGLNLLGFALMEVRSLLRDTRRAA